MSALSRRPGLRVGLLLTPPMLWLGVAYLSALASLLIVSLWTQNDFTGNIERTWTICWMVCIRRDCPTNRSLRHRSRR